MYGLVEFLSVNCDELSFVQDYIQEDYSEQINRQFSDIPYVMTLLNCLLSTWYGLPFVSPHNILVSIINGTGAVIEIIYVLIFILFAPKKEKIKIFGLFTVVLSVFSVVVFVSLFALHDTYRKMFCGFAAVIFLVIMYGSPLSIMSLVIKRKSVEFMPFFLSVFVFLCDTSWFIFGLLGHDPFIAFVTTVACGVEGHGSAGLVVESSEPLNSEGSRVKVLVGTGL
ncbi:unnamed protein product [Vicia faba]|uniref:Bidirectional sugar transporter SWEET n=1 Tax=Vicia faba TaxID=3906 RepID=A0AAV0ZRF2_VICFA|nr:unnamed protein product [Vicia faba]